MTQPPDEQPTVAWTPPEEPPDDAEPAATPIDAAPAEPRRARVDAAPAAPIDAPAAADPASAPGAPADSPPDAQNPLISWAPSGAAAAGAAGATGAATGAADAAGAAGAAATPGAVVGWEPPSSVLPPSAVEGYRHGRRRLAHRGVAARRLDPVHPDHRRPRRVHRRRRRHVLPGHVRHDRPHGDPHDRVQLPVLRRACGPVAGVRPWACARWACGSSTRPGRRPLAIGPAVIRWALFGYPLDHPDPHPGPRVGRVLGARRAGPSSCSSRPRSATRTRVSTTASPAARCCVASGPAVAGPSSAACSSSACSSCWRSSCRSSSWPTPGRSSGRSSGARWSSRWSCRADRRRRRPRPGAARWPGRHGPGRLPRGGPPGRRPHGRLPRRRVDGRAVFPADRAGRLAPRFPAARARGARAARRHPRRLPPADRAERDALAAPGLPGLLRDDRVRARDPRRDADRHARAEPDAVADLADRHGARGGRRRLAARGARACRRRSTACSPTRPRRRRSSRWPARARRPDSTSRPRAWPAGRTCPRCGSTPRRRRTARSRRRA